MVCFRYISVNTLQKGDDDDDDDDDDEHNVFRAHAMKTYRGIRSTAVLIPTLGTRWR
jgi:hypothetical protein